jgi:uncharacterized membrane protein
MRFWELDAIRGIAIILVVIFHTVYDLCAFTAYDIEVNDPRWIFIGRLAATLFIFISGIALHLNYYSAIDKGLAYAQKRMLDRSLRIGLIALTITAVTWLVFRDDAIWFGILHFLSVAGVLGYFFVQLGWRNIPLGLLIIVLGSYVETIPVSHPYFLWLGFVPEDLDMLDFFPLLPWFGLFLLGIACASFLYVDGRRIFSLHDYSESWAIKPLIFLGQHTLLIYLVHQPIILLILYFVFGLEGLLS